MEKPTDIETLVAVISLVFVLQLVFIVVFAYSRLFGKKKEEYETAGPYDIQAGFNTDLK